MCKNFIEWVMALIRKDMDEYQEDPEKKKLLYEKLKRMRKRQMKIDYTEAVSLAKANTTAIHTFPEIFL